MKNNLRVLHIIPAAFDYFDDIKDYAFGLVGEMNSYEDITANVLTLQYGTPSPTEKEQVEKLAPKQEYLGSQPLAKAVDDFSLYNIIHLHAPFLGAAKKILQWKIKNPEIPLIITYYHGVEATDLIALGIKWYNSYYLKKLFRAADAVTVFPWSAQQAVRILGENGADEKMILLTDFGADNPGSTLNKGLKQEEIVKHFFSLYSHFV